MAHLPLIVLILALVLAGLSAFNVGGGRFNLFAGSFFCYLLYIVIGGAGG